MKKVELRAKARSMGVSIRPALKATSVIRWWLDAAEIDRLHPNWQKVEAAIDWQGIDPASLFEEPKPIVSRSIAAPVKPAVIAKPKKAKKTLLQRAKSLVGM